MHGSSLVGLQLHHQQRLLVRGGTRITEARTTQLHWFSRHHGTAGPGTGAVVVVVASALAVRVRYRWVLVTGTRTCSGSLVAVPLALNSL